MTGPEQHADTVREALAIVWPEGDHAEPNVFTEALAALDALVALAERADALERERDEARQLLTLTCEPDIRVNGCACSPESKCYLHGVLIPQALANGLPEVPAEERRFMHAAGVEYVRAEQARAEADRLREALRFYAAESSYTSPDGRFYGHADLGERARAALSAGEGTPA